MLGNTKNAGTGHGGALKWIGYVSSHYFVMGIKGESELL